MQISLTFGSDFLQFCNNYNNHCTNAILSHLLSDMKCFLCCTYQHTVRLDQVTMLLQSQYSPFWFLKSILYAKIFPFLVFEIYTEKCQVPCFQICSFIPALSSNSQPWNLEKDQSYNHGSPYPEEMNSFLRHFYMINLILMFRLPHIPSVQQQRWTD